MADVERKALVGASKSKSGHSPRLNRSLSIAPDKHTNPSAQRRRNALRMHTRDFLAFCIKALVLLALLSFAKDCAPILPTIVLVLIFPFYALPATIGSMYNVVVNRSHRQRLYNEKGKLSRYNRRWLFWFGGFFVFYLFSSLLFILQAPSWNATEWLLIWGSLPIFFIVFLALQLICKKEYAAKYYKARAIKWSIPISALLLTVLYALLTMQTAIDVQIDLHEVIQNRYLPFAHSPSPLLAETEKFTTFSDCLTQYGVSKLEGAFYPVSLVVNLVMGFSVFAGITSQLGACLLNRSEIESVFRLLPADDNGSEQPIQMRYILILVALWLGLSCGFIWLDQAAKEMRETNEYTWVDQWVNDMAGWAILVAEQTPEHVEDATELVDSATSFIETFTQEKDAYVQEYEPALIDAVNNYYDRCASNSEAYVEWYNSPQGTALRFIPFLGEGSMRDEFEKQVVTAIDAEKLNRQYFEFLAGLKNLYDEFWDAEEMAGIKEAAPIPSFEDAVAAPDNLELWAPWDSDEGKKMIQEILLGQGDGVSSDVHERLMEYINKRRESTISFIEGLPKKLHLDAPSE